MQDPTADLRRFIVDNFLFGQVDRAIGDHDSFLDLGIIDSTGVLELISFIERSYQIRFEDADLVPENLDSIASVAAFVRRKRCVAAAG